MGVGRKTLLAKNRSALLSEAQRAPLPRGSQVIPDLGRPPLEESAMYYGIGNFEMNFFDNITLYILYADDRFLVDRSWFKSADPSKKVHLVFLTDVWFVPVSIQKYAKKVRLLQTRCPILKHHCPDFFRRILIFTLVAVVFPF